MFGPAPYTFGGIRPVTVTPITTTTSLTNNGVSIGTPSSDRLLFVAVSLGDLADSARTVNGVTANGNALTLVARDREHVSNLSFEATIFYIDAGAGTALDGESTANIVVSSTGSVNSMHGVHILTARGGVRPITTAIDTNTGASFSTTLSTTVNPNKGDGIISCAAVNANNLAVITWSGATQFGDFYQNNGTTQLWSQSAHDSKTVAGSRTVGITSSVVMGARAIVTAVIRKK